MNRLSQRGAVNVLLIPFILLLIFFFGVTGFATWSFMSRQDYKNNSDKKAAAAAAKQDEATQATDAVKYAEQEKKPFDTYIGAAAYGNVTVNYPKTWSAYVIESADSGMPINGFFQPKIVPNITDGNNSFALRLQLLQGAYSSVISQYQTRVASGLITIQPYSLPKVPSVVGIRVEGQITPKKQGVIVILPLRNMTLELSTESPDFKADFDTNILPNLSFVP